MGLSEREEKESKRRKKRRFSECVPSGWAYWNKAVRMHIHPQTKEPTHSYGRQIWTQNLVATFSPPILWSHGYHYVQKCSYSWLFFLFPERLIIPFWSSSAYSSSHLFIIHSFMHSSISIHPSNTVHPPTPSLIHLIHSTFSRQFHYSSIQFFSFFTSMYLYIQSTQFLPPTQPSLHPFLIL